MSVTLPALGERTGERTDVRTGEHISAGIDWASTDRAICILDPHGAVLDRFGVTHDAAGLRNLVRRLLVAGVCEVAIERGDGPVVDALLQAELTVLVIAPGQVKNLRSRYGSAGNKDDRFDAYVLADVARTDRHRLRPLQRDSAATAAMRATGLCPGSLTQPTVTFRWGCNTQLRDALCDFAGDSRHANPWATDLYNRAPARGHDHPHAVRILARAWVGIIWRCWHDNLSYDPTRHHALQSHLANTTA